MEVRERQKERGRGDSAEEGGIVYISRHFLQLPGKAVIYLARFYSLISPLCRGITP